MADENELTPAVPAAVLKHDLLILAAQRRRQIDHDSETESNLAEIAAQGMPQTRRFSAPEWSALHD